MTSIMKEMPPDSEAFSSISIDMPAPYFMFSLRREVLRLYAFSQSWKVRQGLVFGFFRVVLTAQLHVLSPNPRESAGAP